MHSTIEYTVFVKYIFERLNLFSQGCYKHVSQKESDVRVPEDLLPDVELIVDGGVRGVLAGQQLPPLSSSQT